MHRERHLYRSREERGHQVMIHGEWWSCDQRFGLTLKASIPAQVLELCRTSGKNETGGILIGRYSASHDCASVCELGPEAPDGSRGPTTFKRGVRRLQQWLDV